MPTRTIVADSFDDSLARLTVDEQAAVKADMYDLQRNPEHPGFQLHRVGDADTECWSARVSRDLRAILFKRGTDTVFAYVGHHDDAYAWAEGRRLEVHPNTGAAQFVAIEERVEERVKRITRVEVDDEVIDPLSARPFAMLDDETLLAYGAPRAWLEPIRGATVNAFLEEIGDALPEETQEFLMSVANGEAPPPPPERARDPFTAPDARRRFYVIETDEELERALKAPWEKWMLFLHPTQREAVDKDHAGPARVTGGPGTGKTVVAVHRAARLAREGRGSVLLTTFSKTLAGRLVGQVDALMARDDGARERVDVMHLHNLAVEAWSGWRGESPRIVGSPELGRIIKRAAETAGGRGISQASLQAEWEMVVDPHGVKSWAEYEIIDRTARGTPLNRAQREHIWPALERVWSLLREEGWSTWSEVCWNLVEHLEADGVAPYAHVVADEVQDFGPAELRLLRALVPDGPNDVFLAGDAHQRIYKPHTPFAKAGLEVRGRSSSLRLNYRTTEQIRRAADGIMQRYRAGDDEEKTPVPASLLSGPEPEFCVVRGVVEEIETVATWLRKLVANGYRPGEIAIFARTNRLLTDRALHAISAAKLESVELREDDSGEAPNRVAIGTMHRSKGLQFRAVAVMGVEKGNVPLESVMQRQADDAAKRAFEERERNLLYVACSRARERLLVTGVGVGSGFVDARST